MYGIYMEMTDTTGGKNTNLLRMRVGEHALHDCAVVLRDLFTEDGYMDKVLDAIKMEVFQMNPQAIHVETRFMITAD